MNTNGGYSINKIQDNNFHIKVKRNSIPYNRKINPIISNNHIQKNDLNIFGPDKKLNKLIKEDLIIKKMNKNKNKFQSLGNTNNLSSLINKQKLNKINNSEKTFQKNKNEKGIIDTLNKIRNNHKKLNTSNKVNKLNSNYTFSNNNNINYNQKSINDYRTKIINNKNKLKNTIFKTSSYNNEFKNSLKNFNINNNNTNNNTKTNKKNNIFIDDTTSNDTDPLTESTNFNKETNLYVYRSEVQYPINNHISLSNLQNNNYNNTFNYKYNNYTLKTINTVNDNNYKRTNLIDSQSRLIENISKSVGNSRAKRKIYNERELEDKCQNNFFSPLQTIISSNERNNISIPNNKQIINSENNFLKIKNKFKKLQENLSPILKTLSNGIYNKNIEQLNNTINYNNDRSNNNAKSCHQFYRKKCFSKEKYDNSNLRYDDEEFSYNENSEIKVNKGIINEQENNIDNYKFYNRNRNKRMNNKLKLITKFCDSVEKFLIFILKNYYQYFISKLNKLIQSKNSKNYRKYTESENSFKNKNLHNLLSRRIKNKKNPKKLYYFENDIISINLSNYKKNNKDNKIYSFQVISRNDNMNNIYKKKSNSINKSLNQLIDKNNGEIIYNRIKKKKNLSFNKIYIPKHKNQKYNKYKSLKIDTGSYIGNLNINQNDLNNNNINNTCNSISLYTQNNEQNIKNYQTINGNDSIIKKINHITALKRKYYNKNYLTISTSNNLNEDIITNNKKIVITVNNNLNDDIITNNKKVQLNSNNVYSKPLFTKIGNKIIEKKYNFNSAQKINNKGNNKKNRLLIDNNALSPSENVYNSEKINKNTIKINNNLLCKKIVKRKKPNNMNDNNLLNNYQNNNIIIENKVLNNNNDSKKENYEKKVKNTEIVNLLNDNLEHKEPEINNTCEIIRSIIVKDVSSKDKLLNVFIKYYESNFKNFNLINHNQNKYSLVVISNESIMLLSATKNKNSKKNKNNKYLHQILSSIIEEDEKSKANPSLNNSNSVISEEDSEKNNTKTDNKSNNNTNFTRNIVIYLTNILQNLLDDNIKTVLYSFMKNLKKIQNKLYLKNSLIEYNSLFKNISKENVNNNSNDNDSYKNKNQIITCNGGNEFEVEVELNNTNNGEEKNNSFNNICCYTADNSLFDDNKKNILIGSLFFKDFEIKDEDYDFKPKKYFSSSSIKQIKNNGNETNIYNENKLKNLIIEIDNKRLKNSFYFWKNGKIDNNFEINGSIDNGMNISERNNEKNKVYNILEMNIDDFNRAKIKNKNNEIKKEIILDNKNDEMENNIHKFKNFLISYLLKK